MASGGSSRRPMFESRSLDIGSDELLFSYDDYAQKKDQTANARQSESTAKNLHENRVGMPLDNVYGQQQEFTRDDVLSAVEICMKKHADDLMRNLEEVSGRLTQLELFYYKLERSVSEFRTDMIHGQSEADMKLKSLEKHVHEVQRSLQIVRDKQELSDARKDLIKSHPSQNEPLNSTLIQKNNEDVSSSKSDPKPLQNNSSPDTSNLQLALPPPNQIPSSSQPVKVAHQTLLHKDPPLPQDRYILSHTNSYYSQPEVHYMPQRVQMQNPPLQTPPFSQYQQQWPQIQPLRPQSPSPSTFSPYPNQPPISEHSFTNHMSHPPLNPQTFTNPSYSPPPPPSQLKIPGYNLPPGYQTNINTPAPQMMRNHPYGEMIEKAVSMGYSRDHVISVVSLMGGNAQQPLDFNALLDELNMQAGGGHSQVWSH